MESMNDKEVESMNDKDDEKFNFIFFIFVILPLVILLTFVCGILSSLVFGVIFKDFC